MKTARIIAIANQKGGVGKTATAMNMAYALAEKGNRVLTLDFDPQSNLTMCFGIDRPEELECTIYHLMMAVIEEVAIPEKEKFILHIGKVDLIPSSIELSAVEVNLVNSMSREGILKTIFESLKNEYDYIVIDCMPSLGMLTINALVACDRVLITATPQYLSAKGLELLLKTIVKVKKRINPSIEIDGILITMFSDRTNLSKEILKLITEAYGSQIRLFENRIPISIKVGESNFQNQSIIEFKPDNKVSIAYKNFVEEYIENER